LLGGLLGSGGGADFTSTAAGQTQFSIMNPSSWIAAGKNLYSGFSNGFSNLFSTDAYTMGPPTAAGSTSSFSPGYSNGFGQALGVAGGIYAGYNEFQNAGGGVAGLAGAASYGVGTYFAGAAASAALSGGLAAGFAAIPVVGWIALAAMLVDKFSGGKLFGTEGTPTGGWNFLDVNATGASQSNRLDLKGQKALFGGAKYSTEDLPASQAQIDAANAFFDAIKKGSDDFAKQFGLTAGVVAAGEFSTKFDKKGNPTGETVSNVVGQRYDNETQQQFAERIQAESFTQDLAAVGIDITKYTQQYIKDADAYSQAVQDAAGAAQLAYQDAKKGVSFLALTGTQTGQTLLDFAAAQEKSGETLAQAYQRLQQAQAQYDSFVGQFAPAATYVDDFEAAMSNLKAVYEANVKQANDLAVAAGASGASVEDLTNIMQATAKQQAALVQQLEGSAQSLAFNLGLTNTGSLDDINSEIQRLQQQAGQGAQAVQSFGHAMRTAAQDATAAINLLLGDLSPLNDNQKLEVAKQGLMAGTVTVDQFDTIARQLYASSQQYADLFNWAQQYAGRGTGSTAGGGGGGSVGTGAHGLSAEDQQRLNDLLKEQATLQAGQTLAQYQTLAQQIAEIASAKGETYEQVIKDMGIDNANLIKGLGIQSQADEDKYFAGIQAQVDSDGQNTSSIVNVLNLILQAIRDGGPIANPQGGRLGPAQTIAAQQSPTPSPIRLGHSRNIRSNLAPTR